MAAGHSLIKRVLFARRPVTLSCHENVRPTGDFPHTEWQRGRGRATSGTLPHLCCQKPNSLPVANG